MTKSAKTNAVDGLHQPPRSSLFATTLTTTTTATNIKPNEAKLTLALVCLFLIATTCGAQDILRRQPASQNANQNQNQNNNINSQLANIQLPPQLASLTPQQLHQLAQIRELQLRQEEEARQQQQQQAAANNQANNSPAPIGIEHERLAVTPTAQPSTAPSSGQIPQPSTAADTNERHDDGAYNESGSEMEGVAASSGTGAEAATSTSGGSSQAAAAAAPTFEVNWNKCPQLEPSESEKNKKTQVITKCLQSAPIPTNLTRENVETHREQIATCALKVEGWFDDTGSYRYDKAEAEIRGKHLEAAIELQVLKFHVACKDEANKKFPRDQNKLIDQVQFYQACMDYYISIVCEIEVSVDQ